jgi:arginyl-tRNA synthetase
VAEDNVDVKQGKRATNVPAHVKNAGKAERALGQVPAVCRQILVAQVADLQDGGVQACLAAASLVGIKLDMAQVCIVADVPEHERSLYPALRVDLTTTVHGRSAILRHLDVPQHVARVLTIGDLGARDLADDAADVNRPARVLEDWIASSCTALLLQHTSPNLRQSLESAVCRALHALPPLQEALMRGADVDVHLATLRRARKPAHFQMDFALKLVPVFKAYCTDPAYSTPQLLAAHVLASLPPDARVASCTISGPGFLSIILAKDYLSDLMQGVAERGVDSPTEVPARVCVDYSSPNIAKDMHVGHLRSTILGDSLCRVLECCGHHVTRVNHLGDWGTQFGMLIAHLKQTFPDFRETTPEVRELTEFYKAAKVRFAQDESFKKLAHDEVVALQNGDETNVRLWRALCAVSERTFLGLYRRLGISDKLEAKGESFYQSRIHSMLEELEAKGLLADDDGMKCMTVDGENVPLIVRKSDGAFGYDATDLAAIRYRLSECGFDRVVYVVDAGQALHFRLVIGGARRAGWLTHGKIAEHCKFGVVCGEDGKRLRTRDGGVVRLVDLMDEACARAARVLKDRAAEGIGRVSHEDEAAVQSTAEAIACSGIKYFDLNRDRLKDYVFSYEAMLSPNGDTAVYLQYAHARMGAILRKSGKDMQAVHLQTRIRLVDETEIDLAVEVLSLTDAMSAVCRDLQLLPLCKWLRDVCVQFSTFVNKCRVLGTAHEDSRLLLVHATAAAMRQAMALLGMHAVEKL